VKAVTTIQGQITSCASSIGQAAALAALSVSDADMQRSFDGMRVKRVSNAMQKHTCSDTVPLVLRSSYATALYIAYRQQLSSIVSVLL
jgi:aspartate/methionine/tyrosine aminotransferase